jgi:hypothetical protein
MGEMLAWLKRLALNWAHSWKQNCEDLEQPDRRHKEIHGDSARTSPAFILDFCLFFCNMCVSIAAQAVFGILLMYLRSLAIDMGQGISAIPFIISSTVDIRCS